MDLMLNDILHLSPEDIRNSKIELNMQAGTHGEPFIDRWLTYPEEDKMNGTCKYCSYWCWYADKRNFYPGNWVFSFTRMPGDEWLFISAAKIVEVTDSWARVDILEQYKPLFGRLMIKLKKGNKYSRYTFNMSTFIDEASVREILPCLYSGDIFEGYDRVNLPFSKLSYIFDGRILPTYYEALNKVMGVYCLTDTNTGKLYIGSATGAEGVKQRWGNYLNSKHGGNKKLIALYKKEGADYFEKYFIFTLLEYFSLSYDPLKVKEREQYWKRCFDTIKNGYNDN